MKIEDLVIGQKYKNKEINESFGCSLMGGMNKSNKTNTLVLTVKHNKPLYNDEWDGDILNYTGMGKHGDQSINYKQNKTLAESHKNGVKVYLFESYKDGEYYYDGEVELVGEPFWDEEPDADFVMRKVVKFPLKRKDSSKKIIYDEKDIIKSEEEKIEKIKTLSKEEIKNRAKKYNPKISYPKEVKTTYIPRNQLISEYTKQRAMGICDLCEKEAPFKDKKGNPYLESHHLIPVSKKGPDTLYNTVALCPNCHRKVHALNRKEDIIKLQRKIKNYLVADNDEENLKNFCKLFDK